MTRQKFSPFFSVLTTSLFIGIFAGTPACKNRSASAAARSQIMSHDVQSIQSNEQHLGLIVRKIKTLSETRKPSDPLLVKLREQAATLRATIKEQKKKFKEENGKSFDAADKAAQAEKKSRDQATNPPTEPTNKKNPPAKPKKSPAQPKKEKKKKKKKQKDVPPPPENPAPPPPKPTEADWMNQGPPKLVMVTEPGFQGNNLTVALLVKREYRDGSIMVESGDTLRTGTFDWQQPVDSNDLLGKYVSVRYTTATGKFNLRAEKVIAVFENGSVATEVTVFDYPIKKYAVHPPSRFSPSTSGNKVGTQVVVSQSLTAGDNRMMVETIIAQFPDGSIATTRPDPHLKNQFIGWKAGSYFFVDPDKSVGHEIFYMNNQESWEKGRVTAVLNDNSVMIGDERYPVGRYDLNAPSRVKSVRNKLTQGLTRGIQGCLSLLHTSRVWLRSISSP